MAKKMSDAALLAQAKKRFRECADAESETRRKFLEDLRFTLNENQWPEELKRERESQGNPCLVFNRAIQFVRNVTNEARQNRTAINVSPFDDSADIDTAEVIQGLVRHIEQASNADHAYDTALFYAAVMGIGWIRVRSDYSDPESFDQELIIEPVPNPLSVYDDPFAKKPDRSDSRYRFFIDVLSPEDIEEQYGETAEGLSDWESSAEGDNDWFTQEGIRVAEYWYVDTKPGVLCLFDDGSTAVVGQASPGDEIEGKTVIRTRETATRQVCWAIITGDRVLAKGEQQGKWIPSAPVLGEETNIDGERHISGIIRNLKDAQRQYNAMRSAQVQAIALTPKAPFIAAKSAIQGFEGLWESANRVNHAVLYYNDMGGRNAPPQRNAVEPPIAAITQAVQQSSEDLKSVTGIYDAALGTRSNETSGKAILARRLEAATANYHLIDNFRRAVRHIGQILIDLIPSRYDNPRVLRILGKDDQPKTIKANQPTVENGVERIYDLTTGKFDVTVSTGPSYASQRQEKVEALMQLLQAYPQLMEVSGDLLIRAMDIPGGDKIAERMAKMLPAPLQDNEQQAPSNPQEQAKIQQLSQMVQQLSQQLEAASDEIKTKRFEIESRERIEAAKLDLERLKLQQSDSANLLAHEIEIIRANIDALRAVEEPPSEQSAEPVQPGGDMPLAA